MNKYRDKSDFEINLAVAHIVLGSGRYDWSSNVKLVKRYVSDDFGLCVDFDPCNNPADAMPIIIENGIAIHPYKTSSPSAFDAEIGEFHGHAVFNKNIYRAAMEVFLMMKDDE